MKAVIFDLFDTLVCETPGRPSQEHVAASLRVSLDDLRQWWRESARQRMTDEFPGYLSSLEAMRRDLGSQATDSELKAVAGQMMKRLPSYPIWSVLFLIVLSCAPMSDLPSNARPDPTPAKLSVPLKPPSTYTLQGTFTAPQHQDGPRPVRAVFTSTGQERHWEVFFHFQFNGAQHAFRGTAEGSLKEGGLHGTIRSFQRRTFTFSGNLKRGVFRGTHAEVFRRGRGAGGPDTGTLTLRAGEVSPPFNR